MSLIARRQSAGAGTMRSLGARRSAAATPGESAPPKIAIVGISSWARVTIVAMTLPRPSVSSGITSVGMMMVDSSVRRSRSESFSSFR